MTNPEVATKKREYEFRRFIQASRRIYEDEIIFHKRN